MIFGTMPILAQEVVKEMPAENVAMLFVVFACVFTALFFFLVLIIISCFGKSIKVLPPSYRPMSPGLVWLLLVPVVSVIIFAMIVFKLPAAHSNYLYDTEGERPGDTGKGVALVWFISSFLLPPVALVCMILYMSKLGDVRRRISRAKARKRAEKSSSSSRRSRRAAPAPSMASSDSWVFNP